MSLGRLKTPPPIIEPTTNATSGSKVNLLEVVWAGAPAVSQRKP
jgi:hypothetical protein